ncbi:SMP-30/gluconolactonase/LRE family protein [Cohnella faecalis]|uniref:SMP-30/gluconolactonase/LRE family protein n=1 Tax=Cohnella faecalis TaxID=2315694 RepID=A0A398CRD1_9BACL|nr:SMP-30/gluconolactonase/LRE family protein [Cohnella faecalis]RIE05092.1 SMP-30/gluconolactonase/LRE family protein [Cohnella faecalis]
MKNADEWEPVALALPPSSLGEGPCWDEGTGTLLWIDITSAKVCRLDPGSGKVESYPAPEWISTIVPCAGGGWIAAAYHSLYRWEPGSSVFEECLRLDGLPAHVRFNDGKAGPDGRLWFGTMDMNGSLPLGSLYRIDRDLSVFEALRGVTCSNGLDWSLDGREMYYIDSAVREVRAYAFDDKQGELGERRTAIRLEEGTNGVPDGMTLDSEGMLWIAQWGGSRVARWNPAGGSLLTEVRLPVLQPSSCAFGGERLQTLYITSASDGLQAAELNAYPRSGALFAVDTSAAGLSGRRPYSFDMAY